MWRRTFKLIWQRFPVLIIGTTDQDRYFHVLGLAVCTNERTEDFEFVFNAIKKASGLYCGKAFISNVLVCDAAKAIHIGFRRVIVQIFRDTESHVFDHIAKRYRTIAATSEVC